MKKMLFISQTLLLKNIGGGLVSENTLKFILQSFKDYNIDILLLGSKNHNLEIEKSNVKIIDFRTRYSKKNTFFNHLFGLSTGINLLIFNKIKRLLKENHYNIVFFDGSFFSKIVKNIKKHSNTKIISYFQNIEYDFCKDLYKKNGFLYFPICYNTIFSEKLTAKYSDYILLINRDEGRRLIELYNRKPDCYIPVSLKKQPVFNIKIIQNNKLNLLFVGSAFFANIDGIKWFIQNVMPYVDANLTIVGKEMEKKLAEFTSGKIKILGYVENIDEIYAQNQVAVAPIFCGAGMKVKIAEAFMHGKYVLATTFAFSGYKKQKNIATLCDNAQQFINAINLHSKEKYFLPEAVEYFDKNYATDVVLEKFNHFLRKKI